MPEQSDTTSRADTYVSVFSRSFLQQRRPLLRMTDADGRGRNKQPFISQRGSRQSRLGGAAEGAAPK